MHLYRVELDDIYLCNAEVGIDCVFLRATTDNAGPTSKYKDTDSTTRAQNAVQGPTSKYKGTSRSTKVQARSFNRDKLAQSFAAENGVILQIAVIATRLWQLTTINCTTPQG